MKGGRSGLSPESNVIDDISELSFLDEQIILNELKKRYQKEKYYTFLGDVLVAINPNKPLSIFDDIHHDIFNNDNADGLRSPHMFWVAQQAYNKLSSTGRGQCILVSGESGSGKTESTKLAISHISYMCSTERDERLHQKIIQINPLLESFGNAVTPMNENSSRFGKLIELYFTEEGNLDGAKIFDYLLEKSRIVNHGIGEQNFHFLYYMLDGLTDEKRQYYYLKDVQHYRVLQDSGVSRRPLDNMECNKTKFNEQIEVMKKVGFSEEAMSSIFTLLSAILNVGNLVFVDDPSVDGVNIEDEYPLRVECDTYQKSNG